MTIHPKLALFVLLFCSCLSQAQFDDLSTLGGLSSNDLLRVEQAFRPQALNSDGTVDILWTVEPGYYLYRKQFRVFANGEEISEVTLPTGETAYDPFFDENLEIYRDEVMLNFTSQDAGQISVRFQGCADAGYCYPPSWVAFELNPDSDSVAYLGLTNGPTESLSESTLSSPAPYVLYAVGLAVILGLVWAGIGKFRASRLKG